MRINFSRQVQIILYGANNDVKLCKYTQVGWLAEKDRGGGQERSHEVIKRDEMRIGDYKGW